MTKLAIIKISGLKKIKKTKKSFDEISINRLTKMLMKKKMLDSILVVDTSDNEKFCIVAIDKDKKTQNIIEHWGLGRITF
jgi:uncharacterized protein with PIN domain